MKRALSALARWQIEHPYRFLAAALLITLGSMPLVMGLSLNSDLAALLPESTQSVRDLRSIRARFAAPQTFSLLIWSDDHEARRRFVEALVPRLLELEGEGVLAVDWSVGEYADFVREHRHLYASREDLVAIRDALIERRDYEHCRRNPFCLSLDDEPEDLETLLEERQRAAERQNPFTGRYPDGLYSHRDGRSVAIFVRTDIQGGDNEGLLRLIASVQRVVRRMEPSGYAPDLRVEYGGGVLEMREELEALTRAAVLATVITLLLVMVAIFAFFRRARAIVLLPLGMLPAVALTFAFAELTVDFLNASSAFLSSIVIGNGINSHVIWLARYFERRRAGEGPEEAARSAHLGTWAATLSAAAAAGIAYASLTVTDFRAFRDFGIIGGIGMILCWVASLLFLPVLAALWDKRRPIVADAPKEKVEKEAKGAEEKSNVYGRALAALTFGAPKVVLLASLLLSVASVVVIHGWVAADPIEYNFENLQSRRPDGPLQRTNARVGASVPTTTGGSALMVMAASAEDAEHAKAELRALIEERPGLFADVRDIHDLMPAGQEQKIPLLREIRQLMVGLRRYADPETQRQIDAHLPPERLETLTYADLPQSIARPFTERRGARGSILYLLYHPDRSQSDGLYLIEATQAARSPHGRDGSPVAVAGTVPVMADLVQAIRDNGPKAVALSFAATVLLLLFTFGAMRARALTLASHLVGIVWMVALMAALGMKVNFLNFVALPITFGNGVDYSVNLMRRYLEEKELGAPSPARAALKETGGAVILCSLTTIIGYMALYASPNQAVNSFGAAMSISEVTCVAAAVVALPAALFLLDRRAEAKSEPEGESGPS